MSINEKVKQWFYQMKAEHGLSADYVLDEGELLNWLAKRKPKLQQRPVSGSLPSEPELIRMLKECRDLLVMCTLIDKSGQSKSLVDKVDSVMGWQ